MSERDLQLQAEDPTLSAAERLTKRVEELEDAISSKRIDLKQIPVAALQRKLFSEWQPEGDQLLLPSSVGPASLAAVPQARVSTTSFTHTSSGSYVAVPFDTEAYDLGAASEQFSVSNASRLTCMVPGLYSMGGIAQWAPNATGHRRLGILINGATFVTESFTHDPQAAVNSTDSVHSEHRLAAGDYIELRSLQNTGGNLATTGVHFWFSWRSN